MGSGDVQPQKSSNPLVDLIESEKRYVEELGAVIRVSTSPILFRLQRGGKGELGRRREVEGRAPSSSRFLASEIDNAIIEEP